MSWNYTFTYNDNVIKYVSRRLYGISAVDIMEIGPDILLELHQRCIFWLSDNLQRGKDYEYNNSSSSVVAEYIYFDKEEDLLAFRLACGI